MKAFYHLMIAGLCFMAAGFVLYLTYTFIMGFIGLGG